MKKNRSRERSLKRIAKLNAKEDKYLPADVDLIDKLNYLVSENKRLSKVFFDSRGVNIAYKHFRKSKAKNTGHREDHEERQGFLSYMTNLAEFLYYKPMENKINRILMSEGIVATMPSISKVTISEASTIFGSVYKLDLRQIRIVTLNGINYKLPEYLHYVKNGYR